MALAYQDYAWHPHDFSYPTTRTETGVGIGTADADRWVVAVLLVNHQATSGGISAVSIGGVSATLLYSAPPLSGDGVTAEFWKANVPTGTTADIAVTTPSGYFWDFSVSTYTCIGEPALYDSDYDTTYSGTTFSVAVDVPAGGAVIAGERNDGAGSFTSWVGVTADATDDVIRNYTGSADELTAETGRTVSWTGTDVSTIDRYHALAVVSLTMPTGGGGGVTGTLAATESGADTAAFTGAVRLDGALAATESGQDTAAFAGSVPISGTLAATEAGSDTAAMSGDVLVRGSLAATESGPDIAVFSGSAPAEISGSLAATESGADTASLSGLVRVSGALAASESGQDSAAFAGSVLVTGTLAAVEAGADVASFSGSAPAPITGSLSATEAGTDTTAISGRVIIAGILAAIESGADTAAFASAEVVNGRHAQPGQSRNGASFGAGNGASLARQANSVSLIEG